MNSTSPASDIRRFFEDAFWERVSRSPQTLTALGIKRHQDRLDDLSDERQQTDRNLLQAQLQQLRQFDFASLAPEDRFSYRIFQYDAEKALDRFQYRFHDYLVNQKFGLHTQFPAFMINMHHIENLQDARHYISRLKAFDQSCNQVLDGLDRRQSMGVVPPVFLFPQMIGDCEEFVGGEENAARIENNVLFEDFTIKLEALDGVSPLERDALIEGVERALQETVFPAYRKLIAHLKRQQASAPEESGAWALPDGAGFYQMCLKQHTSTTLTPDEIHALGIREVARIQQEIIALKTGMEFEGSLQDFFSFARKSPYFYFEQTEQGRQACLAKLDGFIERIRALLPTLFTALPENDLLVKPVERHREKTAGLAFYQGPAADGSRPGIFYVNLSDLRQLPSFMMEALAYHEALPGHHMQFSIANRLRDLPTFRRYIDTNGYVEGWALYSELFTKEQGLYQDPWSDFGRLVEELKRACRLVVDTGIHARRWTRQQAIDYMLAHIPSSLGHVVKEVDRYIVMPGQATSYKVGMAEILSLRARARAALGEQFDIRRFHDELLRHGPLPLPFLAEQIECWMRENQGLPPTETQAATESL
jgi:uncharacterized protein (DUF885 family)